MAEDPRASRSHDALIDAAARLVEHMDVADISVTELVAEAGVSRPTFYQYFADVPAVAAAASARLIDEVFARADARYGACGRPEFVRGVIDEIVAEMGGRRAFYQRVLGGPSSRAASDLVIRYVADRMRERVYGGDADDAVEDRIAAVAAGITWLVVQWVLSDGTGRNAAAAAADRLAELLLRLLPMEVVR